jgi:hypothetical protein
VQAAVGEGDSRAGNEILDRARDEHLAAVGLGEYPLANVNGHSAPRSVGDLDLACVQPRADLEPERPNGVDER